MHGNVNWMIIGDDYTKPRTMLPGSSGAGAMVANCEKTIFIASFERRGFVEKVDFLTSISYGDGSEGYRRRSGVRGSGPWRVITHVALFGFDEATKG